VHWVVGFGLNGIAQNMNLCNFRLSYYNFLTWLTIALEEGAGFARHAGQLKVIRK